MRDQTMRHHLKIVSMLPDFVLGKLDEVNLRRVAMHLEHCPTCRRECANAIHILSAIANVPPPPARLRGEILRQATAIDLVPRRNTSHPATDPAHQSACGRVIRHLGSVARRARNISFGQPSSRRALIAASAAVFLVSGLLGLTYERHYTGVPATVSQDALIETLVRTPAAAYPLDNSDLQIPATGVVFAQPSGHEVYLVANGLPALPPDRRYQVWLFAKGDKVVSPGMVAPGADGEVRALLETPDSFDTYIALALTAEPTSGKHKPTSEEVLGGMFPATSASLPPSLGSANNVIS